MDIRTPWLKIGTLAVVSFLSLLTLSQACEAMGVQDSIPQRNLLQAIPQQIIVDASGRGDYTTVQAAVAAVPDRNPQHLVIRIVAGNYVERVNVPITLPYLIFQEDGANSTSISWNSVASDLGPDGQQLGSYGSASVTVFATNFVARDIAFKVTLLVAHIREDAKFSHGSFGKE